MKGENEKTISEIEIIEKRRKREKETTL